MKEEGKEGGTNERSQGRRNAMGVKGCNLHVYIISSAEALATFQLKYPLLLSDH